MACKTAAETPPAAAAPIRGWTTSRVHFSFASIVFDLSYGFWRYGAQIEPLTDCSDEHAFCLASRTLGVALPRQCADVATGHWAVGDVRTEVVLRHVASSPPIHEPGSDTILYLGNSDRPHQLFVYDPGIGLTGLYWDPRNELDFMAMARMGRLDAWLRGSREVLNRYYFPRTTLAFVGECLR